MTQISDWMKSYHHMNNWFLGGIAVHAFMIKVIQFSETNYFDMIDKESETSMIPENSPRMALERRSLVMLRKNLLKTFSFLPCLWFLHVFVRAPVVVIEIAQEGVDIFDIFWRILPLVYEVIAVGYIIYLCDSTTQLTRKRVNELFEAMIKDNRILSMDLFVSQLEKSSDEEFSTWKTITMNRRFFLAFICSLVSFTIFFVQLTNEVTGSKGIVQIQEEAAELAHKTRTMFVTRSREENIVGTLADDESNYTLSMNDDDDDSGRRNNESNFFWSSLEPLGQPVDMNINRETGDDEEDEDEPIEVTSKPVTVKPVRVRPVFGDF